MSEQELKLNVPRTSQSKVEQAMRRGTVKEVRLRARYFDTPERDLVKAGIALRLRLEGQQWIQTIKMPGAHALERIELNHPANSPELDLSVYADLPVYKKLRKLHDELTVRYETDILRIYRNVRNPVGVVEVSYDQGNILAGGLTLPVSEVEFERVSGHIQAIFLLGMKWQEQFGLILDLRSKAERGDRLAALAHQLHSLDQLTDADADAQRTQRVQAYWAPRPIAPVALKPSMSCSQALSAIMQECLEQIARNSATLAEVDTAGICTMATPEHTHQLRIGLRRLRSAWSLFGPLTSLPPQTWRDELKTHFAGLGSSRDDDVMREIVMPVLTAAGLPPVELDTAISDASAAEVAASKAFQAWQLKLLAWAVQAHPIQTPTNDEAAVTPTEQPALKPLLRKRLHKWRNQLLRDGLMFEALPIEARHDLRKSAKRLRYGLQFAESILPPKKLRKFRRQLACIQDILGEMNDLYVAQEKFQLICQAQPEAWFAVGWITSRLEALQAQAQQAFRTLKDSASF